MEKEELIESLKSRSYLKSERVEKAFREVERENFVEKKYRQDAYSDKPLPLKSGQTISAPHMVCMMTELLDTQGNEKVLEIGSGSGFQAAILSKLVEEVVTVEQIPELYEIAKENLESYENVHLFQGDGSKGFPDRAPYDKILVTCASPRLPEPLKRQLKEGGLIVIPEGGQKAQELIVYRKENGEFSKENYGTVRFVPMRGELGFD